MFSFSDLNKQQDVLWKTHLKNDEDLEKTAKELGLSVSKTSRIIKQIKYKLNHKLNVNKFKEPTIMSLNDLTEFEDIL